VSDQFDSPRQALAYAYKCMLGPQVTPAGTAARSTDGTPWDAPLVRALLYGPNPGRVDETTGLWGEGCGVKPGSELDCELYGWAMGHEGQGLSPRARDVVRRLVKLMEAHGVKPEREPVQASDVFRWTDPEGRTWASLRRR
jgi:hypothetical protein